MLYYAQMAENKAMVMFEQVFTQDAVRDGDFFLP